MPNLTDHFSQPNNLLVNLSAFSQPEDADSEKWANLGDVEDHPEISSAFCMLNIILSDSMSLFSTQKLRRFLLADWNSVAGTEVIGGGQVGPSTRVESHTAAYSLCRKVSLYEDRRRAPEGPLGYLSRG